MDVWKLAAGTVRCFRRYGIYTPRIERTDRMATYIMLITLTPEGRRAAREEADYLLALEDKIAAPGVNMMGLYAVLGQYDYVTIVEAPDNEAVARFSLDLGVEAGVHIETLPVIPASRLDDEEQNSRARVTLLQPLGNEERR
jgi:uncharacterized protein with GYD domain